MSAARVPCSDRSFCVQIPLSLSLYPPPMPHLQASEKLHSPIGLLKINVRTSLCGREMASEPNILKRDGGALSSGNSTLMQRERGKKEAKARKGKQRFGRSLKSARRRAGVGRGGPGVGRRPGVGRGCARCRARAGGEKSGGTVGKRQRGSKLSNRQEKAKGKAQESRHQH